MLASKLGECRDSLALIAHLWVPSFHFSSPFCGRVRSGDIWQTQVFSYGGRTVDLFLSCIGLNVIVVCS